jgi:hypothetical protein
MSIRIHLRLFQKKRKNLLTVTTTRENKEPRIRKKEKKENYTRKKLSLERERMIKRKKDNPSSYFDWTSRWDLFPSSLGHTIFSVP